jgi:hypothetical protein
MASHTERGADGRVLMSVMISGGYCWREMENCSYKMEVCCTAAQVGYQLRLPRLIFRRLKPLLPTTDAVKSLSTRRMLVLHLEQADLVFESVYRRTNPCGRYLRRPPLSFRAPEKSFRPGVTSTTKLART